jgi:hypothetical protein
MTTLVEAAGVEAAGVKTGMKATLKAAGLAGILALATMTTAPSLGAAQLDNGLPEGQPLVTQLDGNVSAITYWTSDKEGWHVVTTVDTVLHEVSGAEQHAVIRFNAQLQPGQSQTLSVPVSAVQPPASLCITRIGDRITVERIGPTH